MTIGRINPFRLLFRLGKVVNKKKVQVEGFEKYFNKGSGKFESNDVNLSEVVVKDGNKAKDGVSLCHVSWELTKAVTFGLHRTHNMLG